jgi:hypothetical protein
MSWRSRINRSRNLEPQLIEIIERQKDHLRAFRAANEQLADENAELKAAATVETDSARALRIMNESLALFAPPAGYRLATPAEVAAYKRACEKIGMKVRLSKGGAAVPINFHLTDGEYVDWNNPAYLRNCHACGAVL